MEILHESATNRLQVDEHRCLATDAIDLVEIERQPGSSRNRRKVNQRVGRATECLKNGARVPKRLFGNQRTRERPVTLRHCDRALTGELAESQSL
jgi:hypothetical protein